jgi:ATP-binding cassette, subfamily B, bacterial
MPSNQERQLNIPNTPIRLFVFVTRGYLWWAIIATVLVVVASSASVYLRMLVEQLVNDIQTDQTAGTLVVLLLYPVLFFGISVAWRLSGVSGSAWLVGVPKTTTDLLTKYVSRHSHGYYGNRFAGSLSNKVSNVSRSMEDFVSIFLWSFLENIVPLLITGVIFWRTDFMIGVSFVVMVFFTLILNIILMPRKRQLSLDLAAAQSKTTGFVVDVITNISAVRQFVRNDNEIENVRIYTADIQKKARRSFLYSEYMMLVNSIVFAAFTLFSFLVLSDKWLTGEVSSGRLVSFILLVTYISGTIIFLGRIVSQFAKSYGQAEEGLNEIMVPLEIQDTENATILNVTHGEIIWDKVGFDFGDNQVFKDFNLTIKDGERVGLVGHSGAGKTTFVSLLLRQHDVTSGQICIDGQNIAEVAQDSLRQAIAVVPQEPLLFHRTIRENIAYGNPSATEEEIIAVAKKAQAHDFISALPEGYETLVGERGVKLSGGQKQRVAIARAMLKNAPILVLDEATSALDSESEVAIQAALHELMTGKTVIAIAHRLSTLREMDRIIVLENGQVIEDGSHEVLKDAGGVYQRLWEHQAGGFLTE